MQRVFDARLLFLHLDFGCCAYLDHRHASGELRHAFLQLFLVVVGGRFLDLCADLLHPRFDRRLFARAIDDRGVFLGDFDALGTAQVLEGRVLELQAQLFRDNGASREDRDVLEHRLAAIAESRRLHGDGFQNPSDVVDDQRRQRLAIDVLGDDQKLLAGLRYLLEQRQKIANVADLFVVQKDQRLIENGGLLVGIIDKVRRDVAAIELHAFDEVELVFQTLAILDGDDAFLAHLVHSIGDGLADRFVRVGRDRSYLRNFLAGRARLADLLELFDYADDGLVDPAFEVHRVHARGNVFHSFLNDRLRKHGRRGRAVTGDV